MRAGEALKLEVEHGGLSLAQGPVGPVGMGKQECGEAGSSGPLRGGRKPGGEGGDSCKEVGKEFEKQTKDL